MGWFVGVVKVCLAFMVVYFTALVLDTQFAFLETVGLQILSITQGRSIAWQKVAGYLFVFGFMGYILYKD